MTEKVLEYCIRGIVRYLGGDINTFNKYVNKARKINKNTCSCGGQTVLCKYNKRLARICTHCGIVLQDGRIAQRCLVNSRRAS
jgi:hypothetical protein